VYRAAQQGDEADKAGQLRSLAAYPQCSIDTTSGMANERLQQNGASPARPFNGEASRHPLASQTLHRWVGRVAKRAGQQRKPTLSNGARLTPAFVQSLPESHVSRCTSLRDARTSERVRTVGGFLYVMRAGHARAMGAAGGRHHWATDVAGCRVQSNKGRKLTRPANDGALQLIPGVGLT